MIINNILLEINLLCSKIKTNKASIIKDLVYYKILKVNFHKEIA